MTDSIRTAVIPPAPLSDSELFLQENVAASARLAFITDHIGSCSVLMYGAAVSFCQVATGVVGHWKSRTVDLSLEALRAECSIVVRVPGGRLRQMSRVPRVYSHPNLENFASCPPAY